jgi:SPP1 family predicted phage head-tail adaptor
MRHRVEIQTQAKTPGASGGTTVVYATEATVWGSLRPLRGRAFIGSVNGDDGGATHVATIRVGPSVSKDRFILVDGARRFAIRSITDADERHRFLAIECAEERA